MENNAHFTLKSGTGKASGKPYTLIAIQVGKWKATHFPTVFEKEYLQENWNNLKPVISFNEVTEQIVLIAGDYEYNFTIESALERKYVAQYFRTIKTTPSADNKDDAKIDLETEDELNENPFN